MNKAEDFSVEDDVDTQNWVGSEASSEFKRTIERLKYESRKQKVLYLRTLGRQERTKLKRKYAAKTAS